ncbi:hypothetical protein RB201_22990 [Streptomyces sp. S1A(2023)]
MGHSMVSGISALAWESNPWMASVSALPNSSASPRTSRLNRFWPTVPSITETISRRTSITLPSVQRAETICETRAAMSAEVFTAAA